LAWKIIRRQLLAQSLVRHSWAAVATVRNIFSFETVVDLTLRYPQLFLAFLKIKEACIYLPGRAFSLMAEHPEPGGGVTR
jgi:hypothetical protein